MKKIFAFTLAAAMSLSSFAVLAGCGDDGENQAPVIEGVQSTVTVMAGEEWDALKGVTATDEEDGDITSEIEVSAVGLTFTNGKTTPTEASPYVGYEVAYNVKDSDGLEADTVYCTLKVNEAASSLVNVYEADFSDITPKYDWTEGNEGEGNNHWWKLKTEGGSAATATLTEGKLAIDVTNRNNAGDGDLMLMRTFTDLTVGQYKFAVWAKTPTTETVKLNMIAELNENSLNESLKDGDTWEDRNLGGGKYDITLTSEYRVFALDFSITQDRVQGEQAEVLFRVGLGINDNPNAFKVDIEKIMIWKEGSVTEGDVYDKSNITSVQDLGLTLELGDGAENHVTTSYESADKAVKLEIAQYNTTGGSWSIVAKIPMTGKQINTTDTYGYSFDIKADHDYSKAEVHCGSADNRDNGNKLYSGDIGTIGTTYKNVYHTFKSDDAAYDETATWIFLGKADNSPTETTNNIYIKNFRFFKVTGQEEPKEYAGKFILFGQASPDSKNPKYPISVYNQSDSLSSFDAAPKGTAYFENNKLVYLIHEGGTSEGHNKLSFGYWDNPITGLPANAYYVVSFKIKASADIEFDLTLHDMEKGWEVSDGGLLIRLMDFDNKQLSAGTTEKTYELISDSPSVEAHAKCELILEFGKFLGTNKDVKIEISDLKIGYRTVQA